MGSVGLNHLMPIILVIATWCIQGFYLHGVPSESDSTCTCKTGYTGPKCEPCDKSCKGHCRQPGPKGCEVCREGYTWEADIGCFDVDECTELGHNPCSRNTFCINTEGSYQCFNCDKGCDGCNGDGPDMCTSCAEGFALKEGVCQDMKVGKKERILEDSRYYTYFGLCLCTCIIFRNNIYIASIIGVLVAIYITLAEFTVTEKTDVKTPIEEALKSAFGATN